MAFAMGFMSFAFHLGMHDKGVSTRIKVFALILKYLCTYSESLCILRITLLSSQIE